MLFLLNNETFLKLIISFALYSRHASTFGGRLPVVWYDFKKDDLLAMYLGRRPSEPFEVFMTPRTRFLLNLEKTFPKPQKRYIFETSGTFSGRPGHVLDVPETSRKRSLGRFILVVRSS